MGCVTSNMWLFREWFDIIRMIIMHNYFNSKIRDSVIWELLNTLLLYQPSIFWNVWPLLTANWFSTLASPVGSLVGLRAASIPVNKVKQCALLIGNSNIHSHCSLFTQGFRLKGLSDGAGITQGKSRNPGTNSVMIKQAEITGQPGGWSLPGRCVSID